MTTYKLLGAAGAMGSNSLTPQAGARLPHNSTLNTPRKCLPATVGWAKSAQAASDRGRDSRLPVPKCTPACSHLQILPAGCVSRHSPWGLWQESAWGNDEGEEWPLSSHGNTSMRFFLLFCFRPASLGPPLSQHLRAPETCGHVFSGIYRCAIQMFPLLS